VAFLRLLALGLLLAGCGAGAGERALAAGRAALKERRFTDALDHYRAASALAAGSARVQAERGAVAELLGEFDEALAAYQAAARLEPSAARRFRVAALAERMGQSALALTLLDANLSTPHLRREAVAQSVARWLDAVERSSADIGMPWLTLPTELVAARVSRYLVDREAAAELLFQVRIEAGDREGALAVARARGWVREGLDYCGKPGERVSAETQALVGMLAAPARTDCLLPIGVEMTDGGLARLGRIVLQDRARNSGDPRVREQAEANLRYRTPAHEVAKLAESLNVTAWRLHHVLNKPAEAITVYEKAIAADPAFSWPYRNIGWAYEMQGNIEKALEWFRKAVEVNPNHWRAYLGVGDAAARLRRVNEAVAAWRQALALNPDDAETHAELGRLLVAVGQKSEGIREVQTAVRLDPSLRREREFLNRELGRDPDNGLSPFSAR
jgi:tetratricopeptide (TPR) repeat protein